MGKEDKTKEKMIEALEEAIKSLKTNKTYKDEYLYPVCIIQHCKSEKGYRVDFHTVL